MYNAYCISKHLLCSKKWFQYQFIYSRIYTYLITANKLKCFYLGTYLMLLGYSFVSIYSILRISRQSNLRLLDPTLMSRLFCIICCEFSKKMQKRKKKSQKMQLRFGKYYLCSI